jgi:two-component system, chemotaxis family, chemotaxis protein CheY
LPERNVPETDRPPNAPRSTNVKKVLVIDDSDTIRQQVKHALAATGYQIIEAVDGVDGLEKLRTIGDLAMALCDVNMPRMSGLEMIAEAQRSGSKVPILMLTTEGQPALIRRARESGAKGWIVKPFKPELLVAAVTKLVDRAPSEPASSAG